MPQFVTDIAPFFPILALVLGLLLGSFYNVCIHRWLTGESIVMPPSHCPHCKKRLYAWELVPVLSWILLRGRCSGCREPISFRYPAVELTSGLWATLCALKLGPGLPFLLLLIIGGGLIVASFIDLEAYLLPDVITLPGAALAFVGAVFVLGVPFQDSLIGAAAGGGLFWLLQVAYRKLKGVEGLGTGDIKLMLLIGALLGWQALPMVLLFGSISALLASGYYIIRARGTGERPLIPFGPFLSLGCLVTALYGKEVWAWYLTAAGLAPM